MSEAQKFNVVLDAELKQVDARRQARDLADAPPKSGSSPSAAAASSPPSLEEVRQEAHQRQLVGLAFSGGGIRSATFNLGFLQGLAGLKMLKYFDYLSTVSGGGYIGAWLTAWIQRRAAEIRAAPVAGAPAPSAAAEIEDKLRPVQEQKAAAADKDELDPIEHLRRHSNYLAPRQGFLSIDTWVLLALYLRNFLLNQLVLLPAAVIVLLLSRLVMFAYYPATSSTSPPGCLYIRYDSDLGAFHRFPITPAWFYSLIAVIAVLMMLALVNLVRAIHAVRQERDVDGRPKSAGWLLGWVILPVVVSAIAFCPLIPNALPWSLRESQANKDSISYHLAVGKSTPEHLENDIKWLKQWPWWIADLSLYMLIAALAIAVPYHVISNIQPTFKFNPVVRWWCFCTGLAWGAMLYGAFRIIDWFYQWDGLEPWQALQISATAQMTAFGPPLLLLTMVLAISLAIGLLRKHMGEELREWHASLCARLLRAAAAWAAINVLALYGTALVLWAGPWVQFALGSGWLFTVIGGVLAAGSDRTGALRPQDIFREVVARCSLPVFVVGIFIIVSLLVHLGIDKPPEFDLMDHSIAPSRFEPKHGSTLITVKRQNKDGKVTTERKTDYQRVTDEAAATGQQYWLSMLNTSDISRHPHFYFTDNDMKFLINELADKRRLVNKGELQEKLARLRARTKPWQLEEFRSGLRIYLRGSDVELDEIRKTIFWLVAARKSPAEIVAVRTLGLASTPLGHVPSLAASTPLPNAAVQIEFSWEILSVALQTSDVPTTFKQKIIEPGPIQDQLKEFNYRVWDSEALEDEIDEVFPEAWNEATRRMILQRVKGGTGPLTNVEKPVFLFKISAWLVGCMLVMLLAARQINVNAFSLHGMYVNRLVRAYLGASRKPEPLTGADPTKRKPDPITGFDPNDDLLLARLKRNADQTYDGPFPIVNTAMNLVHGGNLAWQERMAESFVFTPQYCGSETTGFRLTDGLQPYADGVKLGTAMAISGAAASPNMGYHSSPAVTFLLTVFNARLGVWLGNPKHEECWQDRGPRWGFLYLLRELFGRTDDTNPYVYLSDGGHFENLGAYELIKRRCRYVVVCDAGQDELHGFEDLGNLVRLVRIDLGIRIELAPDCLQLQKDSHHCRWHCAIGRIRYDEVDPETTVGTLVYIKPSLTGDEPADVLHYASRHPSFPHETTANQFFTESQFESYRALGEHIAESVFKQSLDDARSDANDSLGKVSGASSKGEERQRWCRDLFASLVRHWFAMPPEYDANFVASTRSYIDLQEAWRKDPRLWRLTLDVYPELDPDGSRAARIKETETNEECASREIAELHMLLQMLQVAEDSYLSLNLEKYYAHPLNRGWMDVFYRWTSSGTFRRRWLSLRGEFARDFVHFCERQMRICEVTGIAVRLGGKRLRELPRRLLQEFEREWPDYKDEQKRNLEDAIKAEETLAWAIYPVRASESQADNPELPELPAGFIAVWPNVLAVGVNPKEYSMLMWQRGAYRNAGLGRPAVRQVLEKLEKELARPFRLRVCLPASNLTGPGGKLQKAIWLTFFNQLNFVRARPPANDEQEAFLELHRDFRLPGPPRGG